MPSSAGSSELPARDPVWLSKRTLLIALSVVVVAGGLVRFLGLHFGYPYRLHFDEVFVERMAYAAYDFSFANEELPKFHAYPPALGNQIGGVARLLMSERPAPPDMQQLGRYLVWFFSVLGVLFAAIAGQLAAGRAAALLAGAMMAFSPLLVEQSRYALTDGPTAAFAALVALAGFWIYRRPAWLPYVVAGIAVGVAASYKYAGAFGGLFVLLAHVCSEQRGRLKAWLLLAGAGVLAIGVFVALNFQIAMNPEGWWKKFVTHYQYYSHAHSGFTSDHTWIHAAHFTLAYGLGWGVSASGLLGGAWLALRHRCRDQWVALGCFGVGLLYLIFLGSKPVFLARNLVHGLPFVLIGLAALLAMPLRHVKALRSVGVAVAFVMLAGLGYNAFLVGRHAVVLDGKDTRIRAAEWMRENLDPKQRMAGIGSLPYLPPPALSGVKLRRESLREVKRFGRKRYRYVVLSMGSLDRFLRDPDHEPTRARTLTRQLRALRETARSIAVFEAPPGPGSELFGSTVNVYHDPRIEIFELPGRR